ncbi:MAG: NAD(P)-dependent oxidoreductase [Dehalococcoidia bacterium]
MRVGFIGLGKMGSGMSANVLKAGYPLTVYDIREEAAQPLLRKGATWAGSPRAVAQASDVVLTSLPGPREVEDVALGKDGILQGLAPSGTYIDLSTSSPTLIRRIHTTFKERGCDVMDATVGGRPTVAQEGKLLVMAGGEAAVFQRCRPVLDSFAARVVYCGQVGSGSVCKLVHNAVNFCFILALAESFTLGVKAGVEPRVLWEVVRNGITCNGAEINEALPAIWLKGRFDPPSFALALAHKDMGLTTELGRELHVPMAMNNLTYDQMVEAMNRGWAERDCRSVLLLQEERAGAEVRMPEEPGG